MAESKDQATALVTGAARRLGRAIALDLSHLGWRIGVHYHASAAEAESVVEQIEQAGGRAVALRADLTVEAELQSLIAACSEELGPPTCLINNAACFDWDSIATLRWEDWQRAIDVNLRAPIFLAQTFAKSLPPEAEGCVINMIDQRVWNLRPDFFSYTIAKSALWTATRMLAQAVAPKIRVNALGPGPVLPNRLQSEEEFERECRSTPLGRGASVEEICRAVRFLVQSRSVTGQMIALDGGQHLGA